MIAEVSITSQPSISVVGNWPGVTVEKKEGRLKGHRDVIITDLPGSLPP